MFEKLYLKRISKTYDIDINNYFEVIYLKKILEDMTQYLSGSILNFKTKVEFLEEKNKYYYNTGKTLSCAYLDEEIKNNKTGLKKLIKESKKRQKEIDVLDVQTSRLNRR